MSFDRLKTLKDLPKVIIGVLDATKYDPKYFEDKCYAESDLRAEGIKWVKTEDPLHLKTITTLDWLNFFNITDEELSNE